MEKPYKEAADNGEAYQISFIRERMQQKKISLRELSRLTGINQSDLSLWFRNKQKISHNSFLQILGALEIRPYLILAESDNNEFLKINFN